MESTIKPEKLFMFRYNSIVYSSALKTIKYQWIFYYHKLVKLVVDNAFHTNFSTKLQETNSSTLLIKPLQNNLDLSCSQNVGIKYGNPT